MIFSKTKSEIYYILSILLKFNDIDILSKIIKYKYNLEDKENLNYHINLGIKLNKIRINKYKDPFYEMLLYRPYNDTLINIQNIQIRIHFLKLCIESLSLFGFLLVYKDNKYNIPDIKDKIYIINKSLKDGYSDFLNKIFSHKSFIYTDLIGNNCIRSIIFNKRLNILEYKTIAISNENNNFIEPVQRLPTLI